MPTALRSRENRNNAVRTVKRPACRIHGVGIDVVDRTRIKQFLTRHPDRVCHRFLNSRERRKFRRLRLNDFAELFTAKEAFFKACGEAWMGLEGFQGMQITKRDGDSFEMRWKLIRSKKTYRGEGFFFRDGDLVGAQAMIWS